jgi:hypothetical protein
MRNFWKRKFCGWALLTILFGVNLGLLATPNLAHALAPDVVAWNTGNKIVDTIAKYIFDALSSALMASLINILMNELNTFAFESAVWVASGGNAEDPLFDPRLPEDFFRDAGASIAADLRNELTELPIGDIIDKYGVNLPDDPDLLAAIQRGIKSGYNPDLNYPDFDFNSIKGNWSGYLISVYTDDQATPQEKTEVVLTALAKSFDPGANELTASMQVYGEILNQTQVQANLQAESFQQNDGFVDLTNAIGDYIETPSSFVNKKIKDAIERTQSGSANIATNLLANSQGLVQVGTSAASIFANSLVSELLNKLNKGLFANIATDFTAVNPFDSNAVVRSSRERAQERLKSLSTFRPLVLTDFSLLSEFSTCPSNFLGVNRKLYNCVLGTSFASAISLAESGVPTTLAEAIESGYIDGDWPLIPSSDTARNQDSNCYTYGFCHSNLVKMRKARIIPIGWELAAESTSNSSSDPITLNEVMNNFNSCNGDGELDSENPWCHLIDPNWVIKYPETSCRTLAYGQLIQASGTDARSTECVDPQTCIAEDENGNCTGGWGYCVREQNTWNFRGDSCPEQYASCVSFTTEAGEAVDYLTSTVDYAGCTADNAGCQWYASAKRKVDGVWDWPGVNNEILAQEEDSAQQYRIYLNSNVETCDSADAGCTQLVVRDTDTRLNLVTNPSFETDEDDDSWPDTWLATSFAGVEYDNENNDDRSGSAAVRVNRGVFYQAGLTLNQSRFYTYSFYAKQGDTSDTLRSAVFLFDETGEEEIDLAGYSYTGDCEPKDFDGDGKEEALVIDATPSSTTYERFECIFTTPALTTTAKTILAYVYFFDGDVWVDDVQLEQGEDTSIFRDGYGAASTADLTLTYAKMPPAYLGCTGASTDPDECDNYATMCTEQDVGCELFQPTNGDPNITGVTSELDACPATCVGYDTYKQEPTLYEPHGSFPEYLIPDTATECSADEVGCDEFTNLTTEDKEYYTYLRACVTTDQADSNTNNDQEAVFYTWEGSDVNGYQLKTWHLLESDVSGAPDSAAPCTNWTTSIAGIACDDDSDGDGAVDSVTTDCDEHDDIFSEPDCREFYDENGTVHYRLWTQTVTVDDACVSYRKTEISGDSVTDQDANCTDSGGWFATDNNTCLYYGWADESTTCSAAVNGCREYTGGRSANSRQVYEELYEDDGLQPFEADNATETTLSNESIATDGHSLLTTQNVWTYLYEASSVCATTGGCASSTGNLGGSCTVSEGSTSCGTLEGQLQTDKTYTLSFWAKGSGTLDVGFDIDAGSSPDVEVAFDDALTLSGTWQEFQVGPVDMNSSDYPNFGDGSVLVFSPGSASTLYLDNVVLREGEQDITLIKNSWVTPAVCDQDINGNTSDQYYLGCAEYLESDGAAVYLRSFSRLCDEDKVGCTGYFETANSDSEAAAMYNVVCNNVDSGSDGPDEVTESTSCYLFTDSSGTTFDSTSPELCSIRTGESSCQFDTDYLISQVSIDTHPRLSHISLAADTLIVPADRDLFAIVSDDDECVASSASCTEFGQVTYTTDRSAVDSYESVYLMNDPDSYGDILCGRDEQFCQAFDGGSAGTYYFKDPTDQTCEYKTSVTVGSTSYDGWFRTGTNDFCYGTGTCSNDSATSCSNNSDCRVGTCSDTGSTCYADFDCETGETCSISDSTATCAIDSGSYLVGGDYSDIRRNGDSAFDNWTGSCSAEFNGCSEFHDLLDFASDEFYGDTDGESYFFINNDNLDENTLVTSQQCNGQVSNKLGCVLFNDTGEPGLDYNSSATYVASVHADALFGDSSFDLVDPIDCDGGNSVITQPDGTTVDLCAQRCAYRKSELNNATFNASTISSLLDSYEFGGSCYQDSDCSTYVSETGDVVDGTCESRVSSYTISSSSFSFSSGTTDVTRLENDANRVLKINRDRQCSEWLTCSSSQTVWDEATGKYKTICDGIDLCTEYSALGDSSFCSAWNPDDPTVILDSARYASRDVSWYGDEFSGYAVPDSFPVQRLSQVNIAAIGICSSDSTEACDIDTDCETSGDTCVTANEKDFRLAYNAGECSGGYGSECAVGYCADTAAPCASSTDCEPDGGECIVGSCLEVSTTACTTDSDCSSGTCQNDVCVEELGDCGLDYSCADLSSTASCFPSVAVRTGTCYRQSCIVAPNGDQFDEETAEEQVCRAWPEANSPFPNEIVSEWTKLDFTVDNTAFEKSAEIPDLDIPWKPSVLKPNFDRANVCLPGEDCDCNYKKLSNSLGSAVYIDDATDSDDIAKKLSASDSSGISDRLGICSGNEALGAICTKDEDCGDIDFGAKCNPITQEDNIIGLPGYCLERDTGISILGDASQGACITWFPVDQLTGSTDLNAKYKGAGFFEDTYACNKVTGYVDLENSGVGCAENKNSDCNGGASAVDLASCANNVACPPNNIAIMGACMDLDDVDTSSLSYAEYCSEGKWSPGTNADCPYMCIPIGSRHSNGDVCDPSGNEEFSDKHTSFDGTLVYIAESKTNGFDDNISDYQDCALKGVEMTPEVYDDNFISTCSETEAPFCYSYDYIHSGGTDTLDLKFNLNTYVGCSEVTQVATSDESYAWTDRLRGKNSTSFILDNDAASGTNYGIKYVFGTTIGPYGLNLSAQPEDRDGKMPPLRVGQCNIEHSDTGFVYYSNPMDSTETGLYNDCGSLDAGVTESGVTGADPTSTDDLNARTFIDFSFGIGNDSTLNSMVFVPSTDTISTVWNRLNQLFALPTIGKLYEWGKDEVGLGATDGEELDYVQDQTAEEKYSDSDYSTDARDTGNPPTIWALDTDNCYGQYCREGVANTITVNDANEGDQTGVSGFFRGTVKFFAGADKNQLPLRRVIVDWGDGYFSGSDDTDNYYKNHRGLLPDSQTQTYCDVCDSTTSVTCEWGMTADSCDPNYFSYQHNYRCSDSDLVTMDDCTYGDDGLIDSSPCTDGSACYYQPAVHVRDNWGWCSGTCTAGNPIDAYGTDGCFEGDGDSLGSPSDSNSECSYLIFPEEDPTASVDPWIYYDGQIVVTP